MLGWAALLHEVGMQINTRGIQRHSGYILQNLDLPGFNQEQQSLLASLVRFHRKKVRHNEIAEFALHQPEQVNKLIAILRLAVLLNIKRQDDILPKMKISADENTLTLVFPKDWLANKPIFSADLEREATYIQALDLHLDYR
jgi:exopolyphosphatase/guanosine-5'-triphosphate,3'-diphosphate pyrophosphatase